MVNDAPKCCLCSINSSLQQNKQTNKQTMLTCLARWFSQYLTSRLTTSLKGSNALLAWERDPTIQHCTLLCPLYTHELDFYWISILASTVQTAYTVHTWTWFPAGFALYKLHTLYTHVLDFQLDLWLIYSWPLGGSFWNYSNNIDCSFDGAAIYECNFKY